MREKIEELLLKEAEAISNIPITNNYDHALNIIYNYVYIYGKKLITSGIGKAGHVAINLATTFSSTGIPAVFLHPTEAQHGDLGIIQSGDVLLLISNSGKTREVIELINLAYNLHDNIQIIVITGNKDAELPILAKKKHGAVLYTGNPNEVCPLGLTPTASITTMTVITDILVTLMMKKTKFTVEEYAKRHHSGYNSVKAKKMIHYKTK